MYKLRRNVYRVTPMNAYQYRYGMGCGHYYSITVIYGRTVQLYSVSSCKFSLFYHLTTSR